MNTPPENIAGQTDTLRKLHNNVENTLWSIGERNTAERAFIDNVLPTMLHEINAAAREIDALRVQLAEARLLVLQRKRHTPLRELMKSLGLQYIEPDNTRDWNCKPSSFDVAIAKREFMDKLAEKYGFLIPAYWPHKNLSEAAADMGIDLSKLEENDTDTVGKCTTQQTVKGYLKVRREYDAAGETQHNHFDCLACGRTDVSSEYYNLDEFFEKMLTCCECGCAYTLLEGSWYAENGASVTYVQSQSTKNLSEALVDMGIDPSNVDLRDCYM